MAVSTYGSRANRIARAAASGNYTPMHSRTAMSGGPMKAAHQALHAQGAFLPSGQRAIIDWKTKNKSFLEVHKQLKALGIRNNAFFLTLLNPDLQGVDPHDPNITPGQALAVVEECRLNFFYYIREVVRIPAQGSSTVRFKLDRATLAAMYCFYNDINFYLMKPRQTGKTVGICAMLSWAFKFGVTNGEFFFSANTSDNVKANLKKMKTYISLLPPYMANMGTQAIGSDGKIVRRRNNITAYEEPASGNRAKCAKCAISIQAAEEIGRGESHVFEYYDEAEFTPFIDVIVDVSGMAFNTASNNARTYGGHACRIFSSTPGDLGDEKRCARAMTIINDCLTWSEAFYDKGVKALKEAIAAKSKYKVVYIEYSYIQLGYGEKWFMEACHQVGFKAEKIRREILLQRFSGNNLSPFTPDQITELIEGKIPKLWSDQIDPLNELCFFVPKDELKPNRMHIIAVDPSDGTGGDPYAMVVIDPYTLKTVMEFKNEYITPQGFRELLEYLVRKYFHKAIIAIENNRNGSTLIHFFDDSFLKPMLYAASTASQDTNLITDKLDDKGFLKQEIMKNKYYGVKTTVSSREIMMGLLTDTMQFRRDLLTTPYLVQDICDLVVMRGKIQAAPGKHDDMVMAWCIGMYTYYYGEHLERYGFRKGELPDDIVMDEEFTKLRELYNNPIIKQQFPTMYAFYQNELKQKMEEKHRAETSKIKNKVLDDGIGSIKSSLQKHDPDYDKVMAGGMQSKDNSAHAEWRQNMLNKWKALGKH